MLHLSTLCQIFNKAATKYTYTVSLFLILGTCSFAQTWNIPTSVTSPIATGIGTVATAANDGFSILAGGNNVLTITEDGKVGIGTTAPFSKLSVGNGALYVHSQRNSEPFLLETNTSTNSILFQTWEDQFSIGITGMNISQSGAAKFLIGGPAFFVILSSGLVGIGQPSPSAKLHIGGTEPNVIIEGKLLIGTSTWPANTTCNTLHVAGTLGAKEVSVNITKWCDDVFSDTYYLRPLKEVENYITTHKHLPEIPSEKEVIENGVALGEMVKMHMQKIEELTL